MGERILLRSIRRFLADDEAMVEYAHVWRRHRWMLEYVALVAVGVLVTTALLGIGDWPDRVVLALALAAVAAMATTEYRILVQTDRALVVLASSRIRKKAVGLVERLPLGVVVRPIGSNVVLTDWEVDGLVYTTVRRHQRAMSAMATASES